MTVDLQTIWNSLVGVFSVVAPAVLKHLLDRIKEARDAGEAAKAKASEADRALLVYQAHVAETYVQAKTFHGFEERLFGELRAIRERLDEKADKART